MMHVAHDELETKREEEEIIAALEDRDNAYQLQTEWGLF